MKAARRAEEGRQARQERGRRPLCALRRQKNDGTLWTISLSTILL